jgi:RNA polymerase sigma factor (sigma-70 family)
MTYQPSGADVRKAPAPRSWPENPTASDGELLGRFVQRQDQAAFAALVRRHGPMVLASCQRRLHHPQDAEDAMQAAFLALARKAPELTDQTNLACWLYTVAQHAALDAQSSAAARRQRELHAMSRPATDPHEQAAQHEMRRLLDDELNQLPIKFRAPVVLCYLEGQTNEEAAKQLGCPVGTLKFRLAQARDMLRVRLEKRGLVLAAALFADWLARHTQAAHLAAALVENTTELAAQFASAANTAGASTLPAQLATGVLEKMKTQPIATSSGSAASRSPAGKHGPRNSLSSSPPAARAAKAGIGRGYFWMAGAGLLLVSTVLLLAMSFLRPSRDPEVEGILGRLREAQRDWWDNEGFTAGRQIDADFALARLLDKQRDWWENEDLARNGDTNSDRPLARLRELQRAWLDSEGLAQSDPAKDPAGALARLDAVNRRWWRGEGLAKAQSAPATADTVAAEDSPEPSAAELADLTVKLLEKQGTQRFLNSGGTQESEAAVQLGLQWLAAQQQPDGRWQIGKNPGTASWINRSTDITATALALLPFLARGETHKGSQDINTYTKQVEHGIRFLLAQQKPDGSLMGSPTGMYTHALATIALCEDFGMTADPMLKGPCQRAIDYLVKAQSSRLGGWRYGGPGQQDSDLSVSSWVLMALKSGQMAGITPPRETLEKAAAFVQKLETPQGTFNYQLNLPAGHTKPYPATMTAIGLLCRQYVQAQSGGEESRSPNLQRSLDLVLQNPPTIFEGQGGLRYPVVQRPRYTNFYYWYYATYALLPLGGEAWQQWNPQMREMLVRLQNKGEQNAAHKGSWDPEGSQLMEVSGRIGVTSLALLTLEVYYRHLPLNRPEMGEMQKNLTKRTK